MKHEIIYVELKSGFNDNGPAWIGKGFYNRTGKTVYFNGQVFCRSKGIAGNHVDLETGEEYWISGIKKNGTDRHWAGGGIIEIDESSIEEYLDLRGLTSLPAGKYEIVKLNNEPAKEVSRDLENERRSTSFDDSIRFKQISDLTDLELDQLISYYQKIDLPSLYKKSRKGYSEKLDELIKTKGLRSDKNDTQQKGIAT